MDNTQIININFLNVEKHIVDGFVLLYFYTNSCSACKAQESIYIEIANMFSNDVKVGRIDVADNRFLADKFGVRNIPHLILLKNGEKILQMNGIENKQYLINQIKKHTK